MSKTKYIIRKRGLKEIDCGLTGKLGMRKCYDKGNERVYKDGRAMIQCSGRLVTVVAFDEADGAYADRIAGWIGGRQGKVSVLSMDV